MAVTYSGDAATTRTNLGLGSLATKSSVAAAEITDNSVGAAELNVSGNGTSGQVLKSDGDGTMTWGDVDASVDYSGGASSSGQTSIPVGALFAGTLYQTSTNNNSTYNWFMGGYGDTESASSFKQIRVMYSTRLYSNDPNNFVNAQSEITLTSGTYQFLGAGGADASQNNYFDGAALLVRTA
jgi:hypothetical protein